MFLIAQDFWDVVTGNVIKVKKDMKAKPKIYLMVDKILYLVIRSSKSAKEVWEKLQHKYEYKRLLRRLGLLRRLFHVKADNPNTEQYFNEIQSLTKKLAGTEAEIVHEFIGVIMFYGPGDQYEVRYKDIK
jgi:hypothetical protein